MSDRRATIGGMNNYTYRAEWCIDEGQYVARCLEFPGLFARALTAPEAIRGIEEIVAADVVDFESCGGTPRPALTERRYSGRFVVRTSPALHGTLVVEANEQGVSLNQWAVQKLAGRRPPSLDDFL
jgi:predicted RNase H-like HicB family nuclease